MPRFGDDFVQDLPSEELEELPEFCTYEGDDDELAQLKGKLIPTTGVQELVYVGERENIWVERDGERWQPWRFVHIWRRGPDGELIIPKFEPLRPEQPGAMSTGDLASLGYSDADLDRLAKEHLGEEWEPDRPGPSMLRRELFDRLMDKRYG